MLFQAAGLVRFVAIDRPTGKVEFEFLGEHIEHKKEIALFVFHLFRDFAIDCTDECGLLNKGVQKLSEGILQVLERKFLQNAGECDGVGNAPIPFFVFIFPVPKTHTRLDFVHLLLLLRQQLAAVCPCPRLERGSGTFLIH
jgi:hypothetical protein